MNNRKYIVNKDVKVAETESEVYLMYQGSYYVLNDTAKIIWSYLNEGYTVDGVIEQLYSEFNGMVERNILRQDCEHLINELLVDNIFFDISKT